MKSRYTVDQSPFYKLQSKKKLADLLGTDVSSLKFLVANADQEYKEFDLVEKSRHICKPVGYREAIHKRVSDLLCRIEPPEFLFSAYKGRSSIQNALCHQSHAHIIQMDIRRFFDSTKEYWLKHAFERDFGMSADCSWMIARILTANGVLPTGSPASTVLAYWCHADLFSNIAQYCKQKGITFSLFVDDMTFSSSEPMDSNGLIQFVKYQLGRHGLAIKGKKTRIINAVPSMGVCITGVTLRNTSVDASNKVWRSIRTTIASEKASNQGKSRLKGLFSYVQSVKKYSMMDR